MFLTCYSAQEPWYPYDYISFSFPVHVKRCVLPWKSGLKPNKEQSRHAKPNIQMIQQYKQCYLRWDLIVSLRDKSYVAYIGNLIALTPNTPHLISLLQYISIITTINITKCIRISHCRGLCNLEIRVSVSFECNRIS